MKPLLHTKKTIKLFSFLPFLTIREDDHHARYYLFGFVLILTAQKRQNWTRYNYARCPHLGPNLACGGKTILTQNTYCAEHCSFNGCEIHGGGKVFIGKYFHSGVNLLIIAQNHNYDGGKHIPYSPGDFICKDIKIGDFVWVGSNVTILPGTEIGEGAIIQAGAVIHGKIPAYAIAGGNPAKVFKYRDKNHFQKLKKEHRFN